VVFDGKGPHADLANRYGVQALPARILIGRDGRIAEDRAWKLAPDELANSVEAALRVAVKPLPAADVAYLVEGRYRGPKIDVDVKVADSDASKLQLSADAWVADSNYRLAVAKVETEADIAKVYLRLQLPKQAPTTDTVVVAQDKDVKVQLPKDGICAVKVYVDHKIDDDALKSCPRLLALIPIDPAATLYKGPKIRAQLLSTDSIPPEYSLALVAEVSAAQHAMKVDEIVRSETTTQVKVSLAMLPAGESASPDDSLRLYVPLGVDVAKTIEVLVAKRDSSGRPGTYAVAVKLPRY
jgi:hypothetical protein